ncbi:DUF5343 domain-containing protein [Leisingera caerulea]|uniref:DUF5343 domain-containing protein n=1 Tax=Leisingera caerulea TaxID=506591 RepID=UPI0021A69E69|nr:DUF5343 domain-containing protein [Leisingera caerulea]UWQ50062.1 DUF5343 domain-containing protein [Leisingera caerulea]
MAKLPYVTSSGNIEKALTGIKSAAVPERVTQDFVKTILKIPGGSGDQMTAFLKKIDFADGEGKPSRLYTQFRNPASSGRAMAAAIRFAYQPLYVRNEYMHELDDDDLIGLIVEETGQPHDSSQVKYAFNCIKALKNHATFDQPNEADAKNVEEVAPETPGGFRFPSPSVQEGEKSNGQSIGLNLGYTINLNLPATSDQAVFNAIFKSLKENLLREDDA